MVKKRAKSPIKKEKMEVHRIAHYAFFIGLVIAIIAGFFRAYIGPEVLEKGTRMSSDLDQWHR